MVVRLYVNALARESHPASPYCLYNYKSFLGGLSNKTEALGPSVGRRSLEILHGMRSPRLDSIMPCLKLQELLAKYRTYFRIYIDKIYIGAIIITDSYLTMC
jgi:hypothetical protein